MMPPVFLSFQHVLYFLHNLLNRQGTEAQRAFTICGYNGFIAAGHKTLIPDLIEELKKLDAEDILVVAGGVIPRKDYDFLYEAGVKGIYGPGTTISDAAKDLITKIKEAQK